MTDREKIIVRAPNWLGDCIMATPLLGRLRELFPRAQINVMALQGHRDIFEGNPNIDELMLYDSLRFGGRFLSAVSDLRQQRFDRGYILPNSLSSALLFALGGVRKRTGYVQEGRGILLNDPFSWPGQVEHRVVRYLRLCDSAADMPERAKSYKVKIYPGPELKQQATELLAGVDTDRSVALNPCSITPTRRWMPERFAELADRMHDELGLETVLIGGPSPEDRQAAAAVVEASRKAVVTNLAGKTVIGSLAEVLGRVRLMVTCNTGTMHIASTAGTRMVILPGSSDIEITAPWAVPYRLIHKPMECYPCWKNECPRDMDPPECMNAISVEDVMTEVAALLEQG